MMLEICFRITQCVWRRVDGTVDELMLAKETDRCRSRMVGA